jgi:asparagine synthase (glutamine-hydrolysing)
MCGLIGVINLVENSFFPNDLLFVDSAKLTLNHRGPDNFKSIKLSEKLLLGFNRLSIVDKSNDAMQPMETEKSLMIFNGEIYNFESLRHNLNEYDLNFKSYSDAEVLQQYIDHKGLNALNDLNGMFAIAYFNKQSETLHLIRDRFGVKPLYYYVGKDKVFFASEVKALLPIVDKLEINSESLKKYINETMTDFDFSTLYNNISQIGQGCYLSINTRISSQIKWYTPKINRTKSYSKNRNFYDNKFENLLVNAIELRLSSEIPTCMTISGGIDSTTLYTLIKERIGAPIDLFYLDHPGKISSELETVQRLVKKYGDKLTIINSNDQIPTLRDLLNSIKITDFPSWGLSTFNYLNIYQRVQNDGFRIVLEGHGSDELFGGYPFFIKSVAFSSLQKAQVIRYFNFSLHYFQATGVKPSGRNLVLFFLEGLKNIFVKRIQIDINSIIIQTITQSILPIVLRTFDRVQMQSSVEGRAPFLDFRIFEYVSDLSIDFSIGEHGLKSHLKRILKKYGNDFVFDIQTKRGFSADLPQIFKSRQLRNELKQLLDIPHLDNYIQQDLLDKTQNFLNSDSINEFEIFEASRVIQAILFIKITDDTNRLIYK